MEENSRFLSLPALEEPLDNTRPAALRLVEKAMSSGDGGQVATAGDREIGAGGLCALQPWLDASR